jgi:hydrogenase nickel incorporation protein HypA/HybF
MHEMPVTQGILNMALEAAGGRRVTDIYLYVGRMAAVVPSSVDLFFEHLSKDTLAEGAKLHFEMQPVEMTCLDCGQAADLSLWVDERPQVQMARAIAQGCVCGSKRLRVSGGVSFGMTSIEVEDDESQSG